MRIPRPPALAPVLVFLAALQCMRHALPAPLGPLAVMLLLALALGGRAGRLLAAAAVGALLAQIAPGADPPTDFADGRAVAARGVVCAHPRPYGDRAAVDLCVDRLRSRNRIARGPWRLRLDVPSATAGLVLGARVRATGTLGRAPGYDNAYRAPPGRWSLRVKSGRFLAVEAPPPLWLRAAGVARARIDAGFRRAGIERRGIALARAMVLGDAAGLPPPWRRALRRTGLAHLTAASGFNVALVSGFVALLLAFAPRALRLAGAALATIAYLVLVGPEPAMVRATVMALVAGLGLATRRPPLALHALALAAAAMAAADPRVLDDVGFRLSVSATAGLVALGAFLAQRLARSLPRVLAAMLGGSLAAQAASAPFAVAAFGQLAPCAALLNLVYVPLAAVALGLGLAAGGLVLAGAGAVVPALAAVLDLVAWPFEILPRLPPSSLWTISVPPRLTVGVGAALLVVALAAWRRARRPVALALLALATGDHGPEPADRAEIVVLDVGQGDAVLVRAGDHAVLIDGGGAPGRDLAVSALLPALERRGIGRLDAVVLSHFDLDHCGGLLDLAGYLPVGEIWLPASAAPTACSTQAVSSFGAPRQLAAGDEITVGALRFAVLHPQPAAAPGEGGGQGNAVSLVLRLEVLGRVVLLTGDLDGGAERRLAARYGRRLACGLLKVAHHGSAASTTGELLAATRPRLAVVSAGVRNAYGHPSEAALARLRRSGARVLRTDRDGGVEIRWRRGEPWSVALPGSPRRTTPRR